MTDLLGIDVRADPAQEPAIAAAVATRRAALTRSIDVAPGTHHFLVFVPVFDGETLRGAVTAMVQDRAWFDALGEEPLRRLPDRARRTGDAGGDPCRRQRARRRSLAARRGDQGSECAMDAACDPDAGAPACDRFEAAGGVAGARCAARDAARAVHLPFPDGAGACARPDRGQCAAARGHRGEAARRTGAARERGTDPPHHCRHQGPRDLHARRRWPDRHLESGRHGAHRLRRRRRAGPRFRVALSARCRARGAGNADGRRARRLDRGGMLAPAQGRQPLPWRRHDLGHPRRRRRAEGIFRGHPRRDPTHRAARSNRAVARFLLLAVFRHPQSRLALRREWRLRLRQQRVAGLYGPHARGRARRRLEGGHPPARSRGVAAGVRPGAARPRAVRARIPVAPPQRRMGLAYLLRPSLPRYERRLQRFSLLVPRHHRAPRHGERAQGKRAALRGDDVQRAGNGVPARAQGGRRLRVRLHQPRLRAAHRRARGESAARCRRVLCAGAGGRSPASRRDAAKRRPPSCRPGTGTDACIPRTRPPKNG